MALFCFALLHPIASTVYWPHVTEVPLLADWHDGLHMGYSEQTNSCGPPPVEHNWHHHQGKTFQEDSLIGTQPGVSQVDIS
jgi:hypothetical protein